MIAPCISGHLDARQLRAFALEIERAVKVPTGGWIIGTQKKGMKAVKAMSKILEHWEPQLQLRNV